MDKAKDIFIELPMDEIELLESLGVLKRVEED